VWTYSKVKQRLEQRSVKTLIARSYYVTEDGSGETDMLEQLLQQFESDAAPILRHLCTVSGRFDLSPQDRLDLAEYIGLLHTRVPAAGEVFKGFVEAEMQRQLERELRDPELLPVLAEQAGVPPSGFEAWRIGMLARFARGDRLRASPVMRLGAMMAGLRWIAPRIASMRWTIFKRYSFPHLLLGDNPAAIAFMGDEDDLTKGLLAPGAFIAMPLDPCTILCVTHVSQDGRVLSLDDLDRRLQGIAIPWIFPDGRIASDVGLRYSWLAWKTSDRWIIGSTEADLRAIHDRLPPEIRAARGGGQLISHAVRPDEAGN
jgi:hypothetical protein